jgi:hypothetical protein
LTAWCQQHDPVTYEPRPGRTYEHASIVSIESAEILAFLLSLQPRRPAAERAIEAGAKWLRQVRMDGYRSDRAKEQALVPDRGAHVWARFYEIGTNRPIFSDRDGIIKYSIEEIGGGTEGARSPRVRDGLPPRRRSVNQRRRREVAGCCSPPRGRRFRRPTDPGPSSARAQQLD